MIRKVQQIGDKGSYILTLPKNWCVENNVSHGSELELSLDQITKGSVLITLPKQQSKQSKREVIISFDDLVDQRMIGRSILGRYLNGFEIIKITDIPEIKKLEVRKTIKALIQKLYVSRETDIIDNSIEIHVSNELISPITVIEDLFIKAQNMVIDSVNAYFEGDVELAEDVVLRDEDADKLYFYIVRTLKKILRDPLTGMELFSRTEGSSFSIEESLDLRMIATYLENLADSAEMLAETTLAKYEIPTSSKKNKEIVQIFSRLNRMLNRSFESFKDEDQTKAIMILDEIKELKRKIQKKFENCDPTLRNILNELTECVIDIADLVGE
ncbi:MAG: phosphate uptake regulator PhoU [Candidatus Heimdallarchaeota archaeon]|nr:phosphate uptake regulator PhoU [Candidatus Heimdallarchaeota archaeon]